MAKIVDSAGREHEQIIATRDALVPDPLLGFNRRVFAGRPVPLGLEAGYKAAEPKAAKPAAAPTKKGAQKGGK